MCVLQWEGTVNANKQEQSQATLQRFAAYPASRDQSHCILSYLQEIIAFPTTQTINQAVAEWQNMLLIIICPYDQPIQPISIYIVIHEGITNSTGQFLWIAPLTLGMAKDDSPLNDWMRGIWNIIVVIIIGVNCCVKPVSRCELYPNDSSQYLLIVYHFHTPHISTNYHLCQCFCAKTMESHKKKLGPLFPPLLVARKDHQNLPSDPRIQSPWPISPNNLLDQHLLTWDHKMIGCDLALLATRRVANKSQEFLSLQHLLLLWLLLLLLLLTLLSKHLYT